MLLDSNTLDPPARDENDLAPIVFSNPCWPRCFAPFERPVLNKISVLDVLYFVVRGLSMLHPCVIPPFRGIIVTSLVIKALQSRF